MFTDFARNAKSRKNGALIDPGQRDASSKHGL
jgi:hypothetical protein